MATNVFYVSFKRYWILHKVYTCVNYIISISNNMLDILKFLSLSVHHAFRPILSISNNLMNIPKPSTGALIIQPYHCPNFFNLSNIP